MVKSQLNSLLKLPKYKGFSRQHSSELFRLFSNGSFINNNNNNNNNNNQRTNESFSSSVVDTNTSTTSSDSDSNTRSGIETTRKSAKRVWRSTSTSSPGEKTSSVYQNIWRRAVDDTDLSSMRIVVNRIGIQEQQGGRMRQRKLGVLREDPQEDMRLLIENYTVPALASALRDREDVLQHCASLLSENNIDELREILRPYESQYVDQRRQKETNIDLMHGFDKSSIDLLRKGLIRMPRRVSQAHQRRAGVVLPLCNVDGVPCILFEKRSTDLRAHPDEVCLPGGMVSTASDRSIVATCLREMSEEIEGIDEKDVSVLGVLRCNWGEVHHLVGVAVTPVVCFIGDITTIDLRPNPDEVAECFTVPLDLFLDAERWVHRKDFAPMFTGGPYPIWGLTGYIINRFVKDVLARYRVQTPITEPFYPKFKP